MNRQKRTDTEEMGTRMKIYREIECQLDKLYRDAECFGKIAAEVFGRGRGKSQLRNLENIANSTQKVADVQDYIKRQTARMREWSNKNFGPGLLEFIKTDIPKNRKAIVDRLAINDEFKEQEIYVQLIRGFIKQLVIHYEWCLEVKKP